MKKKTLTILDSQEVFLKRKTKEMRERMPEELKDKATESRVIQGLLSFWMALEEGKKDSIVNPA